MRIDPQSSRWKRVRKMAFNSIALGIASVWLVSVLYTGSLSAKSVVGTLHRKSRVNSMVADVEMEISSSNANFKKTFRYKQTIKSPDKVRIDLMDQEGSLIINGDKVSVKAGSLEKDFETGGDMASMIAALGTNPFAETDMVLGMSDKFKKKRKKLGRNVYTLSNGGSDSNVAAGTDPRSNIEIDIDTDQGVIDEIRMYGEGERLARTIRYSDYLTVESSTFATKINTIDNLLYMEKMAPKLAGRMQMTQKYQLKNPRINVPIDENMFTRAKK